MLVGIFKKNFLRQSQASCSSRRQHISQNVKTVPESLPVQTWMTDEMRLRQIQWQLHQVQAVNEVLLIIYSTVGGPIQGLPSWSDRLKRMISVLLDGMHSPSVDFKHFFYLNPPF